MESGGSELRLAKMQAQQERIRSHRCIALLGGTTNLGDCLIALRYLADQRRLIRGPAIGAYEEAFAQKIGVRCAVSFSSARVGFYGLLRMLGVGSGDEVLLQVPTHIVVVNAIRYTGARPVFVDCTTDTFNIDLEQIEKKVSPRSRVLLIQHTFGIPVDMEKALSVAQRFGLVVIEDCVHALGARYNGKVVGSFGKAAFFSTEETKTISTTMGGMVVTDDSDLAAKVRDFQSSCPLPSTSLTMRYLLKLSLYHFLTQPSWHRYARLLYEVCGRRLPLPRPTTHDELVGLRPKVYEQRLSNAQAALGLRQLARLDGNISHRRMIANLYHEQLTELGFQVTKPPANADPAFVRFPVWVEDRETVVTYAAPYLVMGTWFTSVLEEAVSPEYGHYVAGTCPRAEAAARHLINLPTHPRVRENDARIIVSVVAQALRHSLSDHDNKRNNAI